MAKVITHDGEVYVIRQISRNEKQKLKGLSLTKLYNTYLSFVINKDLNVNNFTGNVETLKIIIKKIQEVL